METIGRYRLERQLGAGAFATVWLGHDDDLDVPVAIKVLAENWSGNADVRQRFIEEARALRRIAHPRVVGVHDIGQLGDGRSYFVMDFADAGTVADLVRDRVELPTALRAGVDTARAVQVLHEHGILHRDVKPSNLLRHHATSGERLMIADLGMAKQLAEASGLTMTAGTPAYMAPEQASGQVALDPRADVYGVAGVAYALITGKPPFPGVRGVADVMTRRPDAQPPPVPVPAPVGVELDTVLRRALAVDRDQRPRTAADLAAQLEDVLKRVVPFDDAEEPTVLRPSPITISPVSLSPVSLYDPRPTTPAPTLTEPDRRIGRLAAMAVIAFVVAAAVVWLVLGLAS